MKDDRRHLPAKGSYNIRDLGGYPTASGKMTVWRRFLRADSLHRLGDGEVERLHSEGLRAVIDLRTGDELIEAPNPFARFADVQFTNIPLFDDLSPAALSRASDEHAHPLLDFYLSALRTRGVAIREIMLQMAAIDDGAVLFNCTAGKDRTGIIAALLLGLAGVSRAQIVADYSLTADFITDLVAEFLALSRARGGDTERYARLLESPSATMAQTLEALEAEHGSVESYLLHVGLTEAECDALRARLLDTDIIQ